MYLENGKPYIIESIGIFDITLSDPTLFYPISRAESRESFARLMERYPQPEKTAAENTVVPEKEPKPAYTEETVAVYPGDKSNLPYDVEIRTLRFDEPEHDPPSAEPVEPKPPAMSEEERLILEHEGRAALSEMGEFLPDFDDAISQAEIDEPPAHRPAVSIPIDGEWQDFPNAAAAEQAAYADFKAASHRNAQNFHITDDALGVGGAKAKFRANMAAIHLLQELEFEGLQASPEQQEILSRYVGWGGLADAFDENNSSSATSPRRKRQRLHPERQRPQAGTSTARNFMRWKLPLDRIQPKNRRSRFTMTSGKSSSPAASPVSRSRSSMKPILRCGRRNCSQRFAPVRCASSWGVLSRWGLA